ncbi:MAG: OmpA family protein, partial [Flavobacteriales bacterium]
MKKALHILTVILIAISLQGVAQAQSQHNLFATNSCELKKNAMDSLDAWTKNHTADKDMLFRVQGFADSRNSDDYNTELAAKRSKAVAEYLRKNGFSNVFEQSFGEGNPVCNEDTPECLALNRRVEIWTNGKDDVLSLSDYFGKKPAQVFYINPKIENQIQGKEGTKVVIPAFAFELNDKTVHDTVRIELTEFYNKGEMLLNGLTTKADDGLIESAGTVHIAAYDKQAQLTLQTGKVIGLAFNNRSVGDGMITFYGGNQTFMNASCKVSSKATQQNTANSLVLNTNTNAQSTSSNLGGIEWKSGVEHYEYIFRDLQLYNNPDIRDDAHGAAKNYIDAHPKYI